LSQVFCAFFRAAQPIQYRHGVVGRIQIRYQIPPALTIEEEPQEGKQITGHTRCFTRTFSIQTAQALTQEFESGLEKPAERHIRTANGTESAGHLTSVPPRQYRLILLFPRRLFFDSDRMD
jgi:hypothetical protein